MQYERSRRWGARVGFWGLVMALALGTAAPAHADRIEATPKALQDVGIEEHLGGQVPLNAVFTTADGETIKLSEVVTGRRPVLLTLNYSDCPMLCNLQLDGLTEALRQVSLVPGKDFDLLTVSINPNEKLERTRTFRDKYLAQYDREGAKAGWHFVTGTELEIQKVAQAVGFLYTYLQKEQEFAHTAAFVMLSPEGVITRYIYGVTFDPRDLRLALVEAAEGKTGTTLDRILLYCFHYDAATGKYAPMAQNIMRVGGAVTLVLLGFPLIAYWRRDARKRARAMARAGAPRYDSTTPTD